MDQYYAKANRPLEGVSPKTRKLCVAQWLRTLRDTVDSNAYNIIVSPLHQEDSPFAKAVTEKKTIDGRDFAGLAIDENGGYGLRYEEIIPMLVEKVQRLEAMIKEIL